MEFALIAKTVFGLILWAVLFFISVIPFSCLYIWKQSACFCAKLLGWIGGWKLIPMEMRDVHCATGILQQTSGTVDSFSIGFLLRIHGTIEVSQLRAHFTKTFLRGEQGKWKYDRLFTSIQQFLGYPFFSELKSLDLSRQIYGVHLTKEELLETYLASWLRKPYPEGNACWEIVVIERVGVAFKIHHAIADGYSAVHFLDKLTQAKYKFPIPERVKVGGSWKALVSLSQSSLHFGKLLGHPNANLFPDFATRELNPAICFGELDLNLLKEIRRKLDVQLHSILLTLFGSALAKHLAKTGNVNLPKNANFVLGLPWPGHPHKTDMGVGTQSKSRRGVFVNHWVNAVATMPLIPEQSLLDKVYSLNEHFATFYSSGLDTLNTNILLPAVSLLPTRGVKMASFLSSGITSGASILVGGSHYELLGKRVININPIAEVSSVPSIQGLLFCFSHSNRFEYSFQGNLSFFPGGREEFNQVAKNGIQEELRNLKKEVDNLKVKE